MKMQISRLNAILIAIIIVLGIIAGYGWLRPTQIPSPPITELTLEQLAMQEGKLVIYGVIDAPDFAGIISKFVSQYPWAKGKIEYVGLAPGEILTRALSEYRAGRVVADLIINTLPTMMPFVLEGATANCNNPMLTIMNYTAGTYDDKDYKWCPAYWLPIVLMYNVEKLKGLGLTPPKDVTDLADPKWKGLIVLNDPKILNNAGALFVSLYPILGNATWTNLMKAIAANKPIIVKSASEAYAKLAAGEAVVGIGLINDYLVGLKKGIPVEIIWTNPIYSLPIASYITKNAPHPNFAKLFLMWFLSGAGQLALSETGRIPMNLVIAQGSILKVMPSGITILPAGYNVPDFYTNPTKWISIFESIFG
jgi:iron(III) transport system substrate-binding protein